jgi:hypothetical protein
MNDKALEELYNKEQQTLQGKGEEEEIDEAQIDQIRKDAEQAQQVQEQMKAVPAQSGIKRRKAMASKPAKRLKRTEDAEHGKEQVEEQKEGEEDVGGSLHSEAQPHGKSSAATDVGSLQALIIHTEDPEEVVDAIPLRAKLPQIVDWFVTDEGLRKVYTFVRADKSSFAYSTWLRVIKEISRDDLNDIISIGVKKYADLANIDVVLIKMAMEHLHVLLDTDIGKQLRERRPDTLIMRWELYENCGVYSLMFTDGHIEYYLVEKKYYFELVTLSEMLTVKLRAKKDSQMALQLIEKIKTQMCTDKFW